MPSTPASPNDAQILRGALSRALPSTSPRTQRTSTPPRPLPRPPAAREPHQPGRPTAMVLGILMTQGP